MQELALNILDIVQNSIRAGATLTEIDVSVVAGILRISIKDNGCGMSPEFLAKVTDPFTTSRTTRKVGMGLPLLKMGAEGSGGSFEITSKEGVGTTVTTTYRVDHIDRMPLGDVADTVASLILTAPDRDFTLNYTVDGKNYCFDTREVRTALSPDDPASAPLDDLELNQWIRSTISENITEINGGIQL